MSSHSVLANIVEMANDCGSLCRVRAGPAQLTLNTVIANDAIDSLEIRPTSMAMPIKPFIAFDTNY